MSDDTLSTAANLGAISGTRLFSGYVGGGDINDYYRFTLATRSNLRLTLSGMSRDADIQLINSAGVAIASSSALGAQDETINRILEPGAYYVRVYAFTDLTYYDLAFSQAAEAAPDNAGNTTGAARNIGTLSGTRTFADYVGPTDTNDYYRFSLAARSNLALTLSGMSSDADLQLINSAGAVIASSLRSGVADEAISRTLDAGAYYVRVLSVSALTYYDLNLTQTAIAPADGAGNTLGAARNIGALNGAYSFNDYVGASDTNDYYRFTLGAAGNVVITLSGMSDDADLRLLNANGSVIATSATYGAVNETIDRALAAGSYYIRVSPWTGGTNYTLNITQGYSIPVDDGTPSGARPISLNTPLNGAIDTPTDQDWYSINLQQGQTYQVSLTGRGTGTNTALASDTYLRILNSNSVQVAFDDDSGAGSDSLLNFIPGATGLYYLSAGGYSGSTGNYTISIQQIGDTISDNTSTTGRISADGQWLSGVVNTERDRDWYQIRLQAGQSYVVDLQGSNSASGLADPYLYGIFNSAGVLLPQTTNDDYGGASDSRVTFSPSTSGIYYIAAGGFGTHTGNYDLRVRTTASQSASPDIGQSTASNQILAIGPQGATSVINQPRDVDWFKVSLIANTSYVINLRGSATGDGSLQDPFFVGVYNNAGVVIPGTSNDDFQGLTNSQITFTPQTSGVYYLAAGGYFNEVGSYRLSIETSAVNPDIAANALTTGAIAVGGTVTGTIEVPEDADWFRATLTAGETYQVNLRGASSNGGSLSDPYFLGVYAASGQAISGSTDDDSGVGRDSFLTFTAPTTGVYFLAASGYGPGVGSYTLSLSRTGVDTTAPASTAFSPADNEPEVDVAANLTITFDENIVAGTGNYRIYSASGTLWRTISAAGNEVSVAGNTVTINPSVNFNAGTSYYVNFDAGVVKDVAGNSVAALTGNTLWNFSTATTPVTSTDTWTIMVYVSADNDLEGAGVDDLNEMESVARPASVNLYATMDRIPGYSTESGNWTDTREGNVLYDTTPTVVSFANQLTSRGELNLGQGSTLTNFINRAVAANPADRYALIIWDHGGGITGSSWDDTNSGDNLTLAEVRSAIDNSNVSKFDIVGFDACLMAMAEQAFDLRGLADYLVASQELEPGDGWAYDQFLPSLVRNPYITASNLAASIVDTYAPQYAGDPNITLSSMDLGGLTALETALDNFVSRALTVGSQDLDQMRLAAASVRPFPSDGSQRYADLGQFMTEVAARVSDTTLRNSALSVYDALDDVVIRQSGTVPAATGMSIYLPYGSDIVSASYNETNYSFLTAVNWDDFLAIL